MIYLKVSIISFNTKAFLQPNSEAVCLTPMQVQNIVSNDFNSNNSSISNKTNNVNLVPTSSYSTTIIMTPSNSNILSSNASRSIQKSTITTVAAKKLLPLPSKAIDKTISDKREIKNFSRKSLKSVDSKTVESKSPKKIVSNDTNNNNRYKKSTNLRKHKILGNSKTIIAKSPKLNEKDTNDNSLVINLVDEDEVENVSCD